MKVWPPRAFVRHNAIDKVATSVQECEPRLNSGPRRLALLPQYTRREKPSLPDLDTARVWLRRNAGSADLPILARNHNSRWYYTTILNGKAHIFQYLYGLPI